MLLWILRRCSSGYFYAKSVLHLRPARRGCISTPRLTSSHILHVHHGAGVAVLFGVAMTACTDLSPVIADYRSVPLEATAVVPVPTPSGSSDTMVTLTGVRVTQGNAVDCPQIRDDAGKIHSVSYLSAAIGLGDRVTVSGVYGVTTTCVGTVLVVAQEAPARI